MDSERKVPSWFLLLLIFVIAGLGAMVILEAKKINPVNTIKESSITAMARQNYNYNNTPKNKLVKIKMQCFDRSKNVEEINK